MDKARVVQEFSFDESLPVHSLEELFALFRELKIGDPQIVLEDEHKMHVAVKDCFCEGLPEMEGHMVCDLEGGRRLLRV
ncbi:hypothetical protein WJ0W_002328 [Paenibacillus melissococcoides]|uniref:Uncharacterized protein n=1 Tax=Paenibacillus melissococcoides TaxID=2912268 RepID=A0ABM9G1J9_9BACL|nr:MULTISPECIES: hypothetical protein [Paenibacillus]MEB9892386.1 hypothetical protein [Bacillus cereus]CAH8245098.1 hypothetical protein WJ0W_002328 [Paenibacillus melissococcoides]CAH8709895.1 hypothetical protein WDD9_002407 [Paenibacillus melissococcoides]CAH8710622.1 hypothetical protein HTL2_002694 [Paenibacillus melissococcoides]GIO81667.1 hypothetical protein J6TS7_52770 [Paenibacillus dendritiformis]